MRGLCGMLCVLRSGLLVVFCFPGGVRSLFLSLLLNVRVCVVYHTHTLRLMPRGAVRSFDASAGGANRNKPPAIVTSAPAQQQQQQQR